MNADLSNFFSALAGGAIAGVAAVYALKLSAADQRRRERESRTAAVQLKVALTNWTSGSNTDSESVSCFHLKACVTAIAQ